jgi:hypothetical protein
MTIGEEIAAGLRREDDLYGSFPESNNCLDCGYDTMPGTPARAESEEMIREQKARGVKNWSVPATLTNESEQYIVHPHVWQAAGMKEWSDRGESGVLCIGCLEKRIGRRLRPDDFDALHVFNDPTLPGTDRRFNRLTGGETMEDLKKYSAPPPARKLDLALAKALGAGRWSEA